MWQVGIQEGKCCATVELISTCEKVGREKEVVEYLNMKRRMMWREW